MKYLIIFLLFVSCGKNPQILKDVTFNVGFISNGRYSCSFFDKRFNKDIVMFGDAVSSQRLKFFNVDGSLIKEVDLSYQAKMLPDISYLWLSNMDSISLFSQGLQKIVTITSLGEKICEVNLSASKSPSGDIYKYSANISPSNIVWKGRTILGCEWRENIFKEENTSTIENVKDYFKNFNNANNIVSVDVNTNNEIEISTIVRRFYKNISRRDLAYVEGYKYSIQDSKLLMFSNFSNRIFILDPNNGLLLRSVEIISSYTSLGIPGIELDDNSIANMQNLVTESAKSGFICNVFFHKSDNQSIVIVQHGVESLKAIRNRTFSIIKYDKHFKKLEEVYFDNKKFNSFSAMMIDNKIWLEYRNTLPTIKKYAVLDL